MRPAGKRWTAVTQRAALLFWITARTMNASMLSAGQPEAGWHAANMEVEQQAAGVEPAAMLDPAALPDDGEPPPAIHAAGRYARVDLEIDAGPRVVALPATGQNKLLRVAEPPTWGLLGAASVMLTVVQARHHRRRRHSGQRR